MQPEWHPGTEWITLGECPHFENYKELLRDYPDGSTPPFIYRGSHYQVFPSGGYTNLNFMFALFNDDYTAYSAINGTSRNVVDNLPDIDAHPPTNGEGYRWIEWPENETPFTEDPPVHFFLEPRRYVFYDLSSDPFPFYKWIPFDVGDFSGEVYLYWPHPPGMTPRWLGIYYHPAPNFRFYSLRRLAGAAIAAPVAALITLLAFFFGAGAAAPSGRRKKIMPLS